MLRRQSKEHVFPFTQLTHPYCPVSRRAVPCHGRCLARGPPAAVGAICRRQLGLLHLLGRQARLGAAAATRLAPGRSPAPAARFRRADARGKPAHHVPPDVGLPPRHRVQCGHAHPVALQARPAPPQRPRRAQVRAATSRGANVPQPVAQHACHAGSGRQLSQQLAERVGGMHSRGCCASSELSWEVPCGALTAPESWWHAARLAQLSAFGGGSGSTSAWSTK